MPEQNKRSFKNILLQILWIFAGAAFIFFFVAAMEEKNKEKCTKVTIDIDGANDNLYVQKSDITKIILNNKEMNPTGKALNKINLSLLEQTVEKNPWVSNARLYIDSRNCLHIDIEQKQPLARIFTTNGNSFYMDTKGGRVPLLDQFSARVPVFTNFPSGNKKLTGNDSLLYAQIFQMSCFLEKNAFWNAQIDQVNITPTNEFELIPQVGNQVIEFGDGTDITQKFRELSAFYKQVLDVQGWEKYDTINVACNNEIFCTKAHNTEHQSEVPNIIFTQAAKNKSVIPGIKKSAMQKIVNPHNTKSLSANTTKNDKLP
jgi:cell division protein FtsQ